MKIEKSAKKYVKISRADGKEDRKNARKRAHDSISPENFQEIVEKQKKMTKKPKRKFKQKKNSAPKSRKNFDKSKTPANNSSSRNKKRKKIID